MPPCLSPLSTPPAHSPVPWSSTQGNRNRTTHATEVNDVSSRSHAICQIVIRHRDAAQRMYGKLSLVDLAGTTHTKQHTERQEGHLKTGVEQLD